MESTLEFMKLPLVYDILSQVEGNCLHEQASVEAQQCSQQQDWLVNITSTILAYLCTQGDKMPPKSRHFRSSLSKLPPFTIEAYVKRILHYAPCERESFLAALMYMDRLSRKCGFVFNSMNIHRSLITSLLIAAKFIEENPVDNVYFATVGGVPVKELNEMELTFLSMLDYAVAVTELEFSLYSQLFENQVKLLLAAKELCGKTMAPVS